MQSDSVEAVNENVAVTKADKEKTEASPNVCTGMASYAKTFSRPLLGYARGRLMIGTSMPSFENYWVGQLLTYFEEGKY